MLTVSIETKFTYMYVVSTLNHEVLDDSVKRAVLVALGHSIFQELTRTQLPKI